MLLFHHPEMLPVASQQKPARYLSPKDLNAAVTELTLQHGFFPEASTPMAGGMSIITFGGPSRNPAKAEQYLLVDPARADQGDPLIVRSVPFAVATDPGGPTLRNVADGLQDSFRLHATSTIAVHTADARKRGDKLAHTLLWSRRWSASHVAIQLSKPEPSEVRLDVVISPPGATTPTRVLWALTDGDSSSTAELVRAAQLFFWTDALDKVLKDYTVVRETG